jgi:hypothetical protein
MPREFAKEVTLQNAVAATGNGTAMDVSGLSALGIQITGTFSATVTFQGTVDGSNWVAVQGVNMNDGSVTNNTTSTGIFMVPVAGLAQFRVAVTWTSGTSVTVKAQGTTADIPQRKDYATKIVEVTLSLDTDAYADEDLLADTQEVANAVRFPGGTALWTSCVVLDKDDQGEDMDIILLRTNVSMGTENSAIAPTDASADEILGIINIDTWDDLTNSQIGVAAGGTDLPIAVDAASGSTSLYVAVKSEGAGTYTASGITLKLGFLQD